jgi:protein gp37
MCDLWSAGVAPEWRVAIWERVRSAQQNAYIVLTKRPERVRGVEIGPDGEWPENLWLGTSITGEWDESGCDDRYLVHDAQSVVPADRLVVSVEPLLGHASGELSRCRPPAWLIVGPQTGPGAQPPERAWVDALVRYADDTGVPLWLKSSFARCMLDLELRQELPAAMTAICGEGR